MVLQGYGYGSVEKHLKINGFVGVRLWVGRKALKNKWFCRGTAMGRSKSIDKSMVLQGYGYGSVTFEGEPLNCLINWTPLGALIEWREAQKYRQLHTFEGEPLNCLIKWKPLGALIEWREAQKC